MTEFDKFANEDLERLVRWGASREGRLILVQQESSDAHVIWNLVIGEALMQLTRDFRKWTITMRFPGTELFPVADWEHALNGKPSPAEVLDVRQQVDFLVSEFDRLVGRPPIELNERLSEYAVQYRRRTLS